jgi:glycosyltransferase involved in cell wall biosynthesis
VVNGKNGYLVPVQNSLALSETLQRLLRYPELRKEMARNARQMAVSEFSIGHIVSDILQVYDDVTR